ncbi:MAG TPA: hypothetical protein VF516_46080 [Kofleriaceae bacterium]
MRIIKALSLTAALLLPVAALTAPLAGRCSDPACCPHCPDCPLCDHGK